MEDIRNLRNSYLDCLIYIGIMFTCIFNCWDKLELKQLRKNNCPIFQGWCRPRSTNEGEGYFLQIGYLEDMLVCFYLYSY